MTFDNGNFVTSDTLKAWTHYVIFPCNCDREHFRF